ncbi:MAG: RNA 3'-terminal phosphate cyclase [Halovenus sp.]
MDRLRARGRTRIRPHARRFRRTRRARSARGEDRQPGCRGCRHIQPGDAAVDRHLGDQLLVFLALAGGALSIPAVTDHVATSLDLLDQFGFDCVLDESGGVSTISAPEQ